MQSQKSKAPSTVNQIKPPKYSKYKTENMIKIRERQQRKGKNLKMQVPLQIKVQQNKIKMAQHSGKY